MTLVRQPTRFPASSTADGMIIMQGDGATRTIFNSRRRIKGHFLPKNEPSQLPAPLLRYLPQSLLTK
jgi:hypothetical protein